MKYLVYIIVALFFLGIGATAAELRRDHGKKNYTFVGCIVILNAILVLILLGMLIGKGPL